MHKHTSTQPPKAAGAHISTLLKKYADIPVLLMLSGGSAMGVLAYIELAHINNQVTIALADERVNVKNKDSNAWQLVRTKWFQSCKKSGAQLCHLAQGTLKKWKAYNKNGKIITLLGMGADGHTAGILPMPQNKSLFNRLFLDTDNWVTEYHHNTTKNPFKDRLTVTAKFLITEVDDIVMYAVGEEKCTRLHKLEDAYDPHIEPMDILTHLKRVDLYTDCEES